MSKICLRHYFLSFLLVICSHSAYSISLDLSLDQVITQFPLPEEIHYQNPTGSILQGQLEHVTYKGDDFGDVSWILDPSVLFSGIISMDVLVGKNSPNHIDAHGHLQMGADKIIYIDNFVASMPASSAFKVASNRKDYRFTGNIKLNIRSGTFQQKPFICYALKGSAVWSGATVSYQKETINLEAVHATLSCENHQVLINTRQVSSDIDSQYQIYISADRQYVISGWAKLHKRFSAKVQKLLGKRANDGKIYTDQTGSL